MIRRPRRTLAASLVAVVLLAVCALVAASCVQILLGQTPLLPFSAMAQAGAQLTGAGVPVLAAAAVVALVGLVLLVVAIRPGNPTVIPLTDSGTGIETGISRRSLDRALTDSATTIDGVTRAGARTRGRTTTVTAHAAFGDPADKKTQVRAALDEQLARIGPARPQRLRVRVTTDKET